MRLARRSGWGGCGTLRRVIETEGYVHLVAMEPDCDYHMQMTLSRTNGNHNLIVEVPRGAAAYVRSPLLRKRYEDVRKFIRERLLAGREPGSEGTLLRSPLWVRLRGQLFYDASHFGDAPRGKKGMKAATIWEIHPVVAMRLVPPPAR